MNLVQLHIVQGGGSGVVVKDPHGEATRVDFSTDACVRGGGGRTSHIRGVLIPGAEDGALSIASVPIHSAQ